MAKQACIANLLVCLLCASWSTAFRIPSSESTFKRFAAEYVQRAKSPESGQISELPNCFVPPLPVALPPGSLDAVLAAVDANITRVWKSAGNIPGSLSVNLIYNQDIIWRKGFGKKNFSDPNSDAPDGDTAYRIGSISKVFTTLLALQLRDQKAWDLDDNVADFIPGFSVVNPFKTSRGITLRQLASHMGGLSRESPCFGTVERGCHDSEREILERLAKMPLLQPPGWRPSYSNLGFSLLGVAEAHLTNHSWVDLANTVIGDLYMNNTHADVPPRSSANIADGYLSNGHLADWIDIGFEAPAGQMFSSTNDLAALMKLVFRTELPVNPETDQILDGETLREWMHPVYMAQDQTGFGLVWELFPGGQYSFLSKSGSINGYLAIMLFVPEIKVGAVALLSNEDYTVFDETAKSLLLAVLGISDLMERFQPPPMLPPMPYDYVGVYTHHSSIPDLQAQINISLVTNTEFHQELRMSPSSFGVGDVLQWHRDDVFQLTVRYTPHGCSIDTDGEANFYVLFDRDADSHVVSASAPGYMYGYVLARQTVP